MTCFVGIGLPSEAANLARRTHAPELVLIYESGTVGAKPTRPAVDRRRRARRDRRCRGQRAGDFQLLAAARPDRCRLPRGRAARPLRQHQHHHDRRDYEHPAVRLPGAGGAPEIAAACMEVVVVLRQSRRTFAERLDFVTSVGFGAGPGSRQQLGLTGGGPTLVITDLGVLRPDPDSLELVLTGIYPGVSVDQVRDTPAGSLTVAADLSELAPPSAA